MTPRYQENLEHYEVLVASSPAIERKGATMPYTSVNGHMFSLLTKEGSLILRLSADDRDAFLKRYKTPTVVLYGAVMKEYVEVPDALLAKTARLKKFFDASLQYVSSLKPKPTTKKTKKKAR
jgi:TfoX/Sxy family transcriptional regulator of competence genes